MPMRKLYPCEAGLWGRIHENVEFLGNPTPGFLKLSNPMRTFSQAIPSTAPLPDFRYRGGLHM
jgi:hypothetical protein